MPRTSINYANTIIYKLVCKDPNITECYVGHTTDFIRRKRSHKNNCYYSSSSKYNLYVYTYIRDNGDWDNWDMIEIQKYNCVDGNEAKKYEREWIETLKASLNSSIPLRTDKEYREANKKQMKEYYEVNKDKIKEYREINKDKIKEYNKEYNKEYREANKDKIKEYFNTKCVCCCGGKYNLYQKKRHELTKKHLNYIESLKV